MLPHKIYRIRMTSTKTIIIRLESSGSVVLGLKMFPLFIGLVDQCENKQLTAIPIIAIDFFADTFIAFFAI